MKRFEDMKRVCPTIQDLAWKSAVEVLSVNEMDVDKACYAVQCEWLQPVYESINSEHKKLKKDEMKEIKMIVSKKDELFSKEVLYVYLYTYVASCLTSPTCTQTLYIYL